LTRKRGVREGWKTPSAGVLVEKKRGLTGTLIDKGGGVSGIPGKVRGCEKSSCADWADGKRKGKKGVEWRGAWLSGFFRGRKLSKRSVVEREA